MLTITLSQLKADITPRLKGTGLRQVTDFYGTAFNAANRMLARIDPMETIRTATLATPFWDQINDYALMTDYKRMIDIRPQANRINQAGLSDFQETPTGQFLRRLESDSFSIRWNNMVRTLRSQRLPAGNVAQMDILDSYTGNGTWVASVDASGLYNEVLNFVAGNGSVGFNLSGSTGSGILTNSTAAVTDLSALNYHDYSFIWVYIPVGYSSRFTRFALVRGSSATAYKSQTASANQDGTAFHDGWNLLSFNWGTATTTGSPDDTQNTYRKLTITYSAGTAINGVFINNWTDSLGDLYEAEYYSEYMFRTSAGVWISTPTDDTDLVNVGPATYEILQNEMMIDITKQIRQSPLKEQEVTEFRRVLNGEPQTRYNKDPRDIGLYAEYTKKFPGQAIVQKSRTYDFDV